MSQLYIVGWSMCQYCHIILTTEHTSEPRAVWVQQISMKQNVGLWMTQWQAPCTFNVMPIGRDCDQLSFLPSQALFLCLQDLVNSLQQEIDMDSEAAQHQASVKWCVSFWPCHKAKKSKKKDKKKVKRMKGKNPSYLEQKGNCVRYWRGEKTTKRVEIF